jgi:branched-chain amino acid transport system substrate-binding protein
MRGMWAQPDENPNWHEPAEARKVRSRWATACQNPRPAKFKTCQNPRNAAPLKRGLNMKTAHTVLAATAACLVTLSAAQAQDKVKIGVLTTLTGPPAVLGGQLRNGFQLAVKTLGGKLGGREVEIIVSDDELKPDVAVGKAKAFVERDKVDFVVGPIFSNILQAIMKPVTDGGAFLISPNAGTSNFAGKECNANFFVTSYQNDQNHEVLGKYAQDKGLKKVFIMAPNYQAGKDSLAGFKRYFKGEVVDEVYVPLNQLDYSAELSKIAAASPEAIFVFLPGGMGVNFVKQFRQAGLADKIVFLSAFTVDEAALPAQQDAAIGFFGGANWAPDLDTPQNKAFVAAYEKEYNAVPASYAFQAYDAALLIDSALKATGGKTDNKDALRAALMKADFKSLRGGFKFNTNHYPIQDFYLVKVAKRADGKYQTEIAQKVFTDYTDPYVKDCAMK